MRGVQRIVRRGTANQDAGYKKLGWNNTQLSDELSQDDIHFKGVSQAELLEQLRRIGLSALAVGDCFLHHLIQQEWDSAGHRFILFITNIVIKSNNVLHVSLSLVAYNTYMYDTIRRARSPSPVKTAIKYIFVYNNYWDGCRNVQCTSYSLFLVIKYFVYRQQFTTQSWLPTKIYPVTVNNRFTTDMNIINHTSKRIRKRLHQFVPKCTR